MDETAELGNSQAVYYKSEEIVGITPRELPDFIIQPRADLVNSLLQYAIKSDFFRRFQLPSAVSSFGDLEDMLDKAYQEVQKGEGGERDEQLKNLGDMLIAFGIKDWRNIAIRANEGTDRNANIKSGMGSSETGMDKDYQISFEQRLDINDGGNTKGIHLPSISQRREARFVFLRDVDGRGVLEQIIIVDKMITPRFHEGEVNVKGSTAERTTVVDVGKEGILGASDLMRITFFDDTDGQYNEADITHVYRSGYREAGSRALNEDGSTIRSAFRSHSNSTEYPDRPSFPVRYNTSFLPRDKSLEELVK